MNNMVNDIKTVERYERKFLVSRIGEKELEHLVRLHPFIFSEIFYKRTVNNIYFDTDDLRNYWDNVCGAQNRVKVRIRWYGDDPFVVEKPTLELKFKNGLAGKKESYTVMPFNLTGANLSAELVKSFKGSELPENLHLMLDTLEPTLFNSYKRRYFLSSDGDFRITIDSDMRFSKIALSQNLFLNMIVDYYHTVLELKYDSNSDDRAGTVSGYFPFRVTRSSKYVTGLERLNHW